VVRPSLAWSIVDRTRGAIIHDDLSTKKAALLDPICEGFAACEGTRLGQAVNDFESSQEGGLAAAVRRQASVLLAPSLRRHPKRGELL